RGAVRGGRRPGAARYNAAGRPQCVRAAGAAAMRKLKKTPPTFSWDEWVPTGTALDQIISSTKQPDLASQYFEWDRRSGRLQLALVPFDGNGTMILLHPSDWEQPARRAQWRGHLFVRRVDLDKLYPSPATPTMTAAHQDDTRPPERRRGRILKHEWIAIAGEIARRCVHSKTGRVLVPKNERNLARQMLAWCQENYGEEPAESEMREAVKAICATLRTADK